MKKIHILLIFILSANAFAQNSIPTFDDPINVVQYQLKNGLTVVLSENHDKPTVFGTVAVKAGGKNDPADATGMAHYLEHMLFKGTQKLGTTNYEEEKVHLDKIDALYESLGKTTDTEKRNSIQKEINEVSKLAGKYAIPNEMDRMLSEIGGQNVNAFTSNDLTVYHNEFPSNKMEEWLSIYSHRFVDPVFRLFQSELETVYEEKNRGNESPINSAFETFLQNFYKKHPYGTQSIIGTTEHLKNPSLLKMYEFFNTNYVANNMILCLVGDFKIEEVKPLIEQYFSTWKEGKVPEFPIYEEADFAKGESKTISGTPIKLFARGYRSPAFGTYDAMMMEIILNILSNDQNSGLFNQLVTNGDLMALEAIPFPMNDYGATIFLTIPKLIGQSFEEADAKLDAAIKKLIDGDYDNDLFEGAKNQWIRNFEEELEDSRDRALLLVDVYGKNMHWHEYLNYAKAMKLITKNDLMETSKKYFGANPFTLYSKMGKHSPEKLSKPAYDPIIPTNETNSEFYKEWSTIKTETHPQEIISLKDKIAFTSSEEIEIKCVSNPVNEIFNLDIVWENGYRQNSKLSLLAELLNNSNPSNMDLNTFKNKLYALGTSIEWSVYEHSFELNITGLDKNMEKSLEVIYDLLQKPIITDKQIATIGDQIKTMRKMEIEEVQTISAILNEYVINGSQSKYLQQASSKEIKKTKSSDFNDLYSTLNDLKIHVNYTGQISSDIITGFVKNLKLKSGKNSSENYVYPTVNHPTTVHFVDVKNSVQSHISFIAKGNNYSKEKSLLNEAFNFYFGYDMSSLLFQEIREFRSLAYSTYGYMKEASNSINKNIFVSYVGCQGDKTPEALNLLHQLITEMPVKEERANSVESSIKNSIESSNPSFREYTDLYERSIRKGYDDNMYLELSKEVNKLSFKEMVDYYNTEIKTLPLHLSVVGNSKKFDKNLLKKHGKITAVKVKSIYKL